MTRTAIEGSFMESGMELANLDSLVVPTIARTSQLRDYLTLTKPEVMFLVILLQEWVVLWLLLSVVPTFVGMAGEGYLVSAATLGAILFYVSYRVSVQRTRIRAKHLLHATVIYLPLLFAALVLNKVA